MESLLFYLTDQWSLIGYFLIAFGIFIEGDAVLFTAGYLSHEGLFQPVLAFLWLLAGGTLGDILWYKLGEYLEGKDNRLVRWLKKITNPLGPHLAEYPKRSLFLSKFIYGVNHAILCKAGALRIPLKTFIKQDLPGNTVWVLVVGGLGYATSVSVVHVKNYIKYTELGLLGGLLLFFALSHIFSKISKKKL